MLSQSIIEAVGNVAIVGYGTMGRYWHKDLVDLGIPPTAISVADDDKEKLTDFVHPPHQAVEKANQIFATMPPKTVVITANTPAHSGILVNAHRSGVRQFGIEKPLCLSKDLDFLMREIGADTRIFTNYLINYSGAVDMLIGCMMSENLIVHQATSIWGKPRDIDPKKRPTVGSLADELTHPLNTILMLIGTNQRVADHGLTCSIDYTPFVNVEAQLAACQRDTSFPKPEELPAAANVNLHINTDSSSRGVWVSIRSAFTAFEQERRIEVLLGLPKAERPTLAVRLDFDVPGIGDRIRMRPYGAPGEISDSSFNNPKLRSLIADGLTYLATGESTGRLQLLNESAAMVELEAEALEDSKER